MNKPNKAYVLTIPRLDKRREVFLDNWKYTGVEVEFFYGLDYKDYNIELGNIYLYRNVPHLFIGGSFFYLLNKLLETKDNEWFICEDDAKPTPHWYTYDWSSISTLNVDMLKCYSYELQINDILYNSNVIDLRPFGAWVGACAFIITRTGIEKLLTSPNYSPFDHLICSVLDWRSTYPNIIIPSAPECSYGRDK